ncbi:MULTISPECIES: hypothetical protein [unclassified Kitasatospora]|uniref:hypothetical protein n=1 Tax=unclassified Kitasatospora TaxID=2633591 RepID=UPI0033F4131D
MSFVLLFLLALVAAIAGVTLFLVRRGGERARRLHSDDVAGMLIEQQLTVRATRMRATYSSVSLHNGTALVTDEVHRYHS